MDFLHKIVGKNVLFVDLETTGFPKRGGMKGGYADYKNNEKYDTSRIVQIGWYYYENFKTDFHIDVNGAKSVIRKPFNFKSIPDDAVKVHGITYEYAKENGIYIKKILKGEFGECLKKCDYFISYNVYFDYSILANELHRAKYFDMYDKLIKLDMNHRVLCMMSISNMYTGKRMKQHEVYELLYKKDADNQHDARGDVLAMLHILKYIIDNPKNMNDKNNNKYYAITVKKTRNPITQEKYYEYLEMCTKLGNVTNAYFETTKGLHVHFVLESDKLEYKMLYPSKYGWHVTCKPIFDMNGWIKYIRKDIHKNIKLNKILNQLYNDPKKS